MKKENPTASCKCGCNQTFLRYDKYGRERKYKKGHFAKGRKVVFTEEHIKNLSKSHKGIQKGKDNPNYKGGKPKCKICEKELSDYKSVLCGECYHKSLRKENHPQWKGGKKVWKAKQHNKRRGLGNFLLNRPFENSEGHHTNFESVIHVPYEINHAVPHDVFTGKNMEIINSMAYFFLLQQNINDLNKIFKGD